MVLQLDCIFMREKGKTKIILLFISKEVDFVVNLTLQELFRIVIKGLKEDLEQQKFVNPLLTWIERE